MANTTALTEQNFKDTVSQGVTLVDFWAEWCGPCKMIEPDIDALAEEYSGKAQVAKVDVDQQPGLAQEFGVQSIPTLLVIKDGEEVKRFVGATKKPELAKALDEQLAG